MVGKGWRVRERSLSSESSLVQGNSPVTKPSVLRQDSQCYFTQDETWLLRWSNPSTFRALNVNTKTSFSALKQRCWINFSGGVNHLNSTVSSAATMTDTSRGTNPACLKRMICKGYKIKTSHRCRFERQNFKISILFHTRIDSAHILNRE